MNIAKNIASYIKKCFLSLYRVQIRIKIVVLGVITIVLLGTMSVDKYLDIKKIEEVHAQNIKKITNVRDLSLAIQELQLERGMSNGPLNFRKGRAELLGTQRNKTDIAMNRIVLLNKKYAALIGELASVREKADKHSVSFSAAFESYVAIVSKLLSDMSYIFILPQGNDERYSIDNIKKLFFAKEKLGILRATIFMICQNGSASKEKLEEIDSLFSQYNYLIDEIIDSNDFFVSERTKEFTALESSQRTFHFIEELLKTGALALGPDEWFSSATKTVDRLQAVCELDLSDIFLALQNSSVHAHRVSSRILYIHIALSVAVLILTLYIVYRIYTPLVRITDFINTSMESGFYSTLNFHSNNEFGVIADSINKLVVHAYNLLSEKDYAAYHDALTGIYNRHKFIELFNEVLNKAEVYRKGFAFIILDIDKFKNINDIYGHQIGDHVLKSLAYVIGENIRSVDIFARWGGEEFVLLLQDADKKGALFLAEKIRAVVESNKFEPVPQVTISLGVALYSKGDTLEAMYVRADKALYTSKEEGRNRVTLCVEDGAAV